MFTADKKRIAILRGGPSFEYEHSLVSGKSVIDNLPEDYFPVDILIDKEGDWYEKGIKKLPHQVFQNIDVCWNLSHGFGESGFLHRLSKDFGVVFVGSDHLSSGISLNKSLAKKVLTQENIQTPYSISLDFDRRDADLLDTISKSLPFPIIVKPNGSGSSFGVGVSRNIFELKKVLENARKFSNKIIVEEYIDGPTVSSGVLEDFRDVPHYSLIPIVVSGSNISSENSEKVKNMAVDVHKILNLKDYSQSDFVVHPKRGVFFLEVNTIPKINEESKFVSSLKSVGSNIKEFVRHILERVTKRR